MHFRSPSLRRTARALAAVSLVCVSRPALAVEIIVNVTPGDNPPTDVGGVLLAVTAETAANIWMDLLPHDDTTTYNIDVFWDHWDNGDIGGSWSEPINTIGIERAPTVTDQFGISQPASWFFDTTPGDDEFDMQQKLYVDLTIPELAFFNDTTPPGLMEVGFLGPAKPGGPAAGKFDLLTVMLHEMGHVLGINLKVEGEYDINPNFLGGISGVGIEESWTHLTDPYCLMFPSPGFATRRLPSAVDLFALADDEGFETLNLKRVDLIGNAFSPALSPFWDYQFNWEGGSFPTARTQVSLRKPATLVGVGHAETLTVGSFGSLVPLSVGAVAQLTVQDFVKIHRQGQLSVTGVPGATGTVQAGAVGVSGGLLSLQGGSVSANRILVVDEPANQKGLIAGHGTLEALSALSNGGQIVADAAGTNEALSIFAPGELDLDGEESSAFYTSIEARHGDLVVVNAPADPSSPVDGFDGAALVNGGHTLSFTEDWTIGVSGRLELGDASPDPATFAMVNPAARLAVQGWIVGEGPGVIDASVDFRGDPALLFDSGARLDFLRDVTIAQLETAKTEAGIIHHAGDATIIGEAFLDLETWDSSATTTIEPNGFFGVRALSFGDGGSFGGALVDRAGRLQIDTHDAVGPLAWTLGQWGSLHFAPVAGVRPVLLGSDLVLVGGLLSGAGDLSVNLDNASGMVSPDSGDSKDPIGTMFIADDHDYAQTGQLYIDLDPDAPVRNDRLQISGHATLGGDLQVRLPGGIPQLGDTFDVLIAHHMSGQFTSVSLPGMPNENTFQVLYLHDVAGIDIVRLVVVKNQS